MKNKSLLCLLLATCLLASCGCSESGGNSSSESESLSSIIESSSESISEEISSESSSSSSSSSKEINYYKITFLDEEGNTLSDHDWPEGVIPYYNYQKASTQTYLYDVLGWSKTADGDVIDIPPVSQEATYYAIVTATERTYTVSFKSNGGSYVAPIVGPYGYVIEQMPGSSRNVYMLDGWFINNVQVSFPYTITGHVTMEAHWSKVM